MNEQEQCVIGVGEMPNLLVAHEFCVKKKKKAEHNAFDRGKIGVQHSADTQTTIRNLLFDPIMEHRECFRKKFLQGL